MRKDEATPHRATIASNEVAASNANEKHKRRQTHINQSPCLRVRSAPR